MSDDFLVPPKMAPELTVPQSDKFVKVSIIDSTSYVKLPVEAFLKPTYKGKDHLTGPSFSFLIEHDSGKRLLFDLGIRKDVENMAPSIVNAIEANGWTVKAEKNTADILQESGVDVGDGAIDAVIFSHHHWDHTGDISTFPESTQLIVGPGFKKAHLPGYPVNKDSPMLQKDFENRDVREIDIAGEGHELKIGRFKAYDYFSDGSFYLLDTPGHAVGHMCGLARTTAPLDGTSTFILMGGDACHHAGEFRPSKFVPLPKEISPSPIPHIQPTCPGHLLQDINRDQSATNTFYLVTESFAHDIDQSHWTVAGLQEFDASDEFLLVVAHDESVLGALDFYPESINRWHEKDLGEKARWRFVADFDKAVKRE